MQTFDAIIIGAGQAGPSLAVDLAQAGKKVLVVEKDAVGGTCVNRGCTPTKTVISSSRVAHLMSRSVDFGIEGRLNGVNMQKIFERKEDVVSRFREGSEKRLLAPNITLLKGEATFSAPCVISVVPSDGTLEPVTFTAPAIFLNTGAIPQVPLIKGLASVPFLDSTAILNLTEVPTHLMVAGGGYISLEFAQLFTRLGSAVTIIEKSDTLLSKEDADVSAGVQKILEEEGVVFRMGTSIESVESRRQVGGMPDVLVSLKKRSHAGEEIADSISASHLLVAAGRVPDTAALNLSAAGVETDEKGYIKVNEFLETTAKGVYALGDVKGGPAFTHVSFDDYRVISHNLLHDDKKSIKDRVIPYCLFIDPELGRTGLTEKEAKKLGYAIKVAKMPMENCARAIEMNETKGFMKAIVDTDSNLILGAAVLGVNGGEVASVLHLAIVHKIKYTDIMNGMFAHPTLSESLNNLFYYLA